jgi:hypothetical protein
MLLTELVAIYIGLVTVHKQKFGRLFIFYIIYDFLTYILDAYVHIYYSAKTFNKFVAITNSLVGVIELFVYYFFFSAIYQSKKLKVAISISFFVYLCISILYFTTRFRFLGINSFFAANILGALEFVFIIPICAIYYIKLFKNISKIPLHTRPSFWIVSGIFFYSVISIPYYLLSHMILKNKFEIRWILTTLLFFLPFVINFLFLTKAFLCKKPLTT